MIELIPKYVTVAIRQQTQLLNKKRRKKKLKLCSKNIHALGLRAAKNPSEEVLLFCALMISNIGF